MSEPLDELRSLAPPVDDRPELLQHVRNHFMTFIERDALSMVMWFSLSAVRWFPRLRSRVVPAGRPR